MKSIAGTILAFHVVCCSKLAENRDISSRIHGGKYAVKNQFPHSVILRAGQPQRICGGSVIDERHILTTAYCVLQNDGKDLRITAGTNWLNEGGESFKVEARIWHESYEKLKRLNDIAIVRLDKPMNFSRSIQPIELYTEREVPSNADVLVMGWGYSNPWWHDHNYSDLLKFIVMQVMSSKHCIASGQGIAGDKGHICLSHTIHEGIWNGDEGAGVVYKKKLLCIANYFSQRYCRACGTTDPDRCVKVSHYAEWIKEKVIKLNSNLQE